MTNSYNDMEPIYKQVEKIITDNITTGKWPLHSKINDEITLSKELNISRGTLRKAIKSLIDKGVLVQMKSKGTFVVSDMIEQPLASRLVSFSEVMNENALKFVTKVISMQKIMPDAGIQAFLEIEKDESVISIERIRLVNNYPTVYLKNYVPYEKCPQLLNEDLENDTLFNLLEVKYKNKIDWGRRYFRAVPALGEVAFNLGLAVGTPVMFLEQITYSERSKPIEYSNVWINSEKYDLSAILKR